MANPNAKSCYQRHNKRPHRYSDLYRSWFNAATGGKTDEARELARKHSGIHLQSVRNDKYWHPSLNLTWQYDGSRWRGPLELKRRDYRE